MEEKEAEVEKKKRKTIIAKITLLHPDLVIS